MCGIFGLMRLAGGSIDPELLDRMSSQIVHRGPDDCGKYVAGMAAIGMQRLSIIDVAGGHQPIGNESGSVQVVCNGEIYNYQELRSDLCSRGHQFSTNSDTEVLVHLYEEYGENLLSRLRGMYAFAIWDANQQRLLLSRDRLGIKPLYYWQTPDTVVFASEIKSILANPEVPREVDPVSLSNYLSLGYTLAPRTMFRGIQKILPAHYLLATRDRVITRRYWNIPQEPSRALPEEEWAEGLLDKLREVVRSHMISDVPLGAFLSGGLDSSSIVCLMAQIMDRPVETFSIGFAEQDKYYDELPFAKTVASACKTKHQEIIVRPDVFELFPKLIWHMDEPIADSAFVTTHLVSEFARRSVTVILSGVGGDELFGGYRRYLGANVARYYNKIPGFIRKSLLPKIVDWLPIDRGSKIKDSFRLAKVFISSNHLSPGASYLNYLSFYSMAGQSQLLNQDLHAFLGQHSQQHPLYEYLPRTERIDLGNWMMFLDMRTQLPDDLLCLTDKMSMASSLECRVPFLDHELVEYAASMPSHLKVHGMKLKYILKKAMAHILPDEILHRSKRGFGAPVGSWLRHDLRPLAEEILSETSVRNRGFFQWPAVKQTMDLHLAEREDHTDQLLALITFELWCRIYLDAGGIQHSIRRSPSRQPIKS